MTRTCPDCGRTWGRKDQWCGACGAHLAPPPPPAAGTSDRRAWRRARVLAGLGVVLLVGVGVVPALVGGAGPWGGSRDTSDDTVALPTTSPTAGTAADDAHSEVRCTRARVPVDCLAWQVDVGEDVSLGPRLPGSGLLVDTAGGALTVRDPATGEVTWQRDDLGDAMAHHVVDGVLVLAADGPLVRAVDATTGADLWQQDGLQAVGQLAGLDAGVVVLGRRHDGDAAVSTLVGLDPRTGTQRWAWTVPWEGAVGSAAQPAGPAGLLVTGAGRLARVDATTGRADWVVDTLEDAYLQPQLPGHVSAEQLRTSADPQLWIHDLDTGEVVHRMPAIRVASHQVVGDLVIAHAPAEGVVRAMDLDSGATRWRVLLETSGALAFPFSPAAPDAVVVLERELRRVTRLAPTTGEPVWQGELGASPRTAGGGVFFGQPMLVGDVVVVEDTSSVITVLDLATGRERVRVVGGSELDVRSLDPLTLVRGSRWMGVAVPPADPPQ